MHSWLRPRNLWTLAGVLLLAAGVFLYILPRCSRRSPPTDRRLMSDAGAEPISLVVCSVNSARRSALRNAQLTANIVNALPPRAGVILAVNDPEAFTVAHNPWPDRVRFLELTPETRITIWPQDPFVVLRDDTKRSTLLVSRDFSRVKDREMAIQLAGFLGRPWRDCPLSFEGGDIVSDEHRAFIGAATIRRNAVALDETDAWVVKKFEAELGKPVLVIGPALQPIGHIDMMLTPLGHMKLLLADAAWGARLAEQQLAEAPDSVEAFETGCEQMFFGAPGISALHYSTGKVVQRPHVVGETRRAIEHSKAMAPHLDRLAEKLTSRGYEVSRVPFLFVRLDPAEAPEADGRRERPAADEAARDQAPPELRYPELTYNNVLLETFEGQRIVYLPQYGWDAFDREARRVWQGLVDDVTPVNGFAVCAMYGGSLRCCTKVLQRGHTEDRE